MAISASILPEFDHEMANTRKMLALVPEDKVDWKPHPKSYALGTLALHIANLPMWTLSTLHQTLLDMDEPENDWTPRAFESTEELVRRFEENAAGARAAIAEASDETMMGNWTFKAGGRELFTMPRVAVLRSFVMNHSIHHRAQLGVYLRMLDIPLPPIYGPTADAAM